MTRGRVIQATLALALALAVAGCAGAANPTTVPAPSAKPSGVAGFGPTMAPSQPAVPSAAPLASAGPHGESLVAATSIFNYQTLAQFIRDNRQVIQGVAVVRIASASPLRWNTPDGTRPSELALDADWSNPTAARYMIGRAFGLRLERVAWGDWTAKGPTEVYWIPGGKLGADEYVNGSAALVPAPVDGGLAVALTITPMVSQPQPPVRTIGFVFPVDASGRVTTIDPAEDITLGDLAQHLP
ncbi:MAG: hypothetical protein HYX54_07115 [Chloroflexi bacterium]|nr:hypothetical protein [Chloroflexota bacterium]